MCTSAERTDVYGSVSSSPLPKSQNRAPLRRGTDARGRSRAGIVGAEPPWGEQPQAKQPRPSPGLSLCGFDSSVFVDAASQGPFWGRFWWVRPARGQQAWIMPLTYGFAPRSQKGVPESGQIRSNPGAGQRSGASRGVVDFWG